MSDRPAPPPNFEAALTEFEALVEKMERGDLSLEDSVSAYERGVVLHRYCEQALFAAERKIRILTESPGEEGEARETLRAFDPEAGAPRRVSEEQSVRPLEVRPPRRRGARQAPGDDDLPF